MVQLNTITCADCLEFVRQVPDEYIDLIIIDPPYGNIVKDEWDKKDVVSHDLAKELFRVLKPTGSLYCWCGIGELNQSLIKWYPIFNKYFHFKDLITWKKKRGIGNRKGWLYTREECMWFVKDNKNFIWNKEHQYSQEEYSIEWQKRLNRKYKRYTNVWEYTEEALQKGNQWNKKFFHSTPKPIELLKRIIQAHTKEGDIILDCFSGSGSSGIAAKELNRNFLLCDNNPEYCYLAAKRMCSYIF